MRRSPFFLEGLLRAPTSLRLARPWLYPIYAAVQAAEPIDAPRSGYWQLACVAVGIIRPSDSRDDRRAIRVVRDAPSDRAFCVAPDQALVATSRWRRRAG